MVALEFDNLREIPLEFLGSFKVKTIRLSYYLGKSE